MRKSIALCILLIANLLCLTLKLSANPRPGKTINFDNGWRFHLRDVVHGEDPDLDDLEWRALNLPHDWSIEGEFSEQNPATPQGGALPGGIGWYRKTFTLPASAKDKSVFIDFDGVYRNSYVWINGHHLGSRPYGYSSFRYELSPYVKYANQKKVIAVRVDNSRQPNSRWYSGSGIYRNVWLTIVGKLHVDLWGTFVTTPDVSDQSANVTIKTKIKNEFPENLPFELETTIHNAAGVEIQRTTSKYEVKRSSITEIDQQLTVSSPVLWSIENPYLYKAVSMKQRGKVVDRYETTSGFGPLISTLRRGSS